MNTQAQWEAFIMKNGVKFNAASPDIDILKNFDSTFSPQKEKVYLLADSILKDKMHGTYADLARNQRFINFCKTNEFYLLGGPMLSNIQANSMDFWLRNPYPAENTIEVYDNNKLVSRSSSFSSFETNLTAVVRIDKLEAQKKYTYNVLVDGKEVKMKKTPSFSLPDKKTDVSIGFGSCYHRIGLANHALSNVLVERGTDALLLMGDVAVQDRNNHTGMHSLDFLMRDLFSAWNYQAAHVPTYATWDDHDYFDNDLYNIPPGFSKSDKSRVYNTFASAWNNPFYGIDTAMNAVFFNTTIGPVDIIMVDNRSLRDSNSLLGSTQMEWLKKQLLACRSPFIILSCGTMWSDYLSNGKDSWGVFDPDGREEVFDFIEKNNIKGVLLISGDRHGARGFRIPRKSGFAFYEFGAASLGSLYGPPVKKDEWTTQLYGTSGIYAFGEFSFDVSTDDPMVTFRLVQDNGDVLYQLTLKRSELSPDQFYTGEGSPE